MPPPVAAVAAVADLLAPPAVVPIFVNAGAALIPTLIASVTSVVAILFKPRELDALVRRKPWIPAAALAIVAAVWLSIAYWPAAAAQGPSQRGAAAPASTAHPKTDWT